jgi:uncharacterized protein
VEQADWEAPDPTSWVAAIDAAVAAAPGPPILVAHSLGALAVVLWAAVAQRPAAGAFLVAPPDVERTDTPPPLRGFGPVPRRRLPFPALVVASRDDPYLAWDRALDLAAAWGAQLLDAGAAGHVNTAAGYGAWPAGERLLARFVAAVDS